MRRAVVLVWALLVVDSVGATVTALRTVGALRDQVLVDQPGLDSEAVAGGVDLLLVGVGIGLLLLVALYVVVALSLRAGRTWPRTVLVVLTAVSVAGLLWPGSAGPADLVWPVVSLGLQVAALVLLFRPAASAWLAARKTVHADARRRRVAW